MALRPVRLPPPLTFIGTVLTLLGSELPVIGFVMLTAATLLAIFEGDFNGPASLVLISLPLVVAAGLGLLVRRALSTSDRAWSALSAGPRPPHRLPQKQHRWPTPWDRILLCPIWFHRRDVEHIADVPYGSAAQLLDLYRPRPKTELNPVFIHLHGGSFRSGHKNREARPLLYGLAAHGWLCLSANYRLGAEGFFPNNLSDVKELIAWARHHGSEWGGDPNRVLIGGSSAGAYLATMAALTANDPRFQAGLEGVDTGVAGVVGLYGYYGPVRTGSDLPTDPVAYVREDAPPFLIIHGSGDVVVPAGNACRLVDALRRVSTQPVVYVELPGAPHGFDFFHSIRFDSLIPVIADFLRSCLPEHGASK